MVVSVRSFSIGARFDSKGVDGFVGGGIGVGAHSGVGIAWAPGAELSHESQVAITANATVADGIGGSGGTLAVAGAPAAAGGAAVATHGASAIVTGEYNLSRNSIPGKGGNNQSIKPEDIAGKSLESIDKMMTERGWKGEPTKQGGGTRYPNPNKPGEQVRVQPGNPKDPNPVKRGPYGRISTDGQKSPPIPLKRNPTLRP